MVLRSSHQTVRLSPGSHSSPEDGACVVELASMLSHEPFSDRPTSVCPALREFLHSYNDGLPDYLRQELYGLASEIVGTRSPAQVTAWRARLCVDWGRSLAALGGVPTRFREWTLTNCSLAGEYSARVACDDSWCHRQTVAFFRWLAHARAPAAALDREPTPSRPIELTVTRLVARRASRPSPRPHILR
jgi:hypothetical protein